MSKSVDKAEEPTKELSQGPLTLISNLITQGKGLFN